MSKRTDSSDSQNQDLVRLIAVYTPNQRELLGSMGSRHAKKSSRLVELLTEQGDKTEVVVPTETIMDWRELRKILVNRGHRPITDDTYWKKLSGKLCSEAGKVFDICNVVGYHENSYLTSTGTVIGSKEKILKLNPDLNFYDVDEYSQGTLKEWQDNVACYATCSKLLMFAICASLSGSLIKFSTIETGGFHIHGDSSKGKSTIFTVLGSICGGKDYVKKWYTTETAVEDAAAKHNDSVLLLDEIKLLLEQSKSMTTTASLLQHLIYMLSGDSGKARANSYQDIAQKWRLVFISNGEKSVAEIMRMGRVERMLGDLARCIDIPVRNDHKFGVFDELPEGFKNSGQLVEHIKKQAYLYFGTAKPAFINGLLGKEINRPGAIARKTSELVETFIQRVGLDRTNGFDSRVAKRFALAYAAGEMARRLKVLKYKETDIFEAVFECYKQAKEEYSQAYQSQEISSNELDKVTNDIVKRLKKSEFLDLQTEQLSQAEVDRARGFKTIIKGNNVIAVKTERFRKLLPNREYERPLIQRFIDAGILMPGSRGLTTRQLTSKVQGKKLPRVYCFIESKLG